MRLLLTFLLFITLFIGCKKSSSEDENYTLSATVLDFDANTAIAGSKVYVKEYSPGKIVDSAISDVNGKVSFSYKKEGSYKYLYPSKNNYLNPINIIAYRANYESRTDVLYLAKPSFMNVTIHKNIVYLPLDTVAIQVLGDHIPSVGQNPNYRILFRDKAEAPDKTFNLQAVYGKGMGSFFYGSLKLYFIQDIIRNGAVISTQTDSTNIIQFGIKNYTLNY